MMLSVSKRALFSLTHIHLSIRAEERLQPTLDFIISMLVSQLICSGSLFSNLWFFNLT